MDRNVVLALVAGLVLGIAAMAAAAPSLPWSVRTSTTTLTQTKLVPTTITAYRTVTTTTSTTVTATSVTTTTATKTVTLTATVTVPVTHTATVTQTTTKTVTVTHIPEMSFELSSRTVEEETSGFNATPEKYIVTYAYGAKTANGTWVFFTSYKKMDMQGNVVDSYTYDIEAKLSKDWNFLVLTWKPRTPFDQTVVVKVEIYDEKGKLIADGTQMVLPGSTEVRIGLHWYAKALPAKLVIEISPIK